MSQSSSVTAWQQRLLPFMVKMVAGLGIFFFIASSIQLAYLHWDIRRLPPLRFSEAVTSLGPSSAAKSEDRLAIARFRALAELELQAMERRYNNANTLLLARLWNNYLGFVTGMILSLVGAAFILGKLRESETQIGIQSAAAEVTLKSASPGVIMAVLGVALMAITIFVHHQIEVTDRPVYLHEYSPPAASGEQPAPPLLENPYEKKPK